MEMIETLKDLGIPTSDLNISGYAHEIPAIIQNMDKLRKKLPYETDGAVIKIDRFERREELGSTSKAPRWAFAFKYETEKAETTLKAVTWQVGRTGNITPVAELEPVLVAGSTVARATLHNIEEVRRKDLKIGDHVLIEKAGEVIPAVIGPLKEKRTGDEKDIDSPLKCPICDQRTLLDGIFVRCTNGDCPEQIVGRLLHFAQRTAMDIEGLGDTIAYGLVSIVGIKSPADLYTLTETQLLTIPRMGDKVAQKILKNIRASKDRGLRAVLFALGIPNASEGTAKRLLEVYDTIDQIAEASVEDLQKIRDVGPIVAQSIHDFLRTPRGRQLVEDLRQHGVKLAAERKAAASAKLAGKIFVITGILSQPRNHFQALIESHGGRCSDSISKNTSYLLAGSDAGSKLAKAEKLKVPIIDEDFLITLLASELPA
jgi:DNA ligase (NAD+)